MDIGYSSMIEKIRSIQDSWFMKAILVLTALSFMSLFGISGYIGSAAQDKSVIEVDDIAISQAQILQQLNRELQTARKLFGEDIEVNDSIRMALLQNIIQKELSNAIIRKTAQDNHVVISDTLVSKIIAAMPEFRGVDGKFNPEQMRMVLSNAGFSESMYINQLKEDIAKQHLVVNPVQGVNVPKFMAEYINKIDNQKKIFKYLTINPENMKISRKISQDEKEQYYSDFAMQFIEPEKRDVSFVAFSIDDIAGAFNPSKDDIEQYYNDNIDQFSEPEKRNVLQMVFDSEDKAMEAKQKLDGGRNFYAVADSIAKQTKEDTELGNVTFEELLPEVAESVFNLDKNKYTNPIKSEFGWHIMKVTSITPMSRKSLAQATKQIIETLRKEQAEVLAETLVAEIEDLSGQGMSLKDIATDKKLNLVSVKNLTEDGKATNVPNKFSFLVKSADFIDNSFSYNVGEISQVFETNDGYAVVSVDNIIESRRQPLNEVENQIVKLWETNEKEAIAQEIINDANHDLENGDKIEDVATRFGLPLKTTRALPRSESFAGLSPLQIKDLFNEALNTPKILQTEDGHILAVNTKIINTNIKPSRADIEATQLRASNALAQNMAQQLINDFGTNYKIKIDYKSLGLAD